MGRKKTKRAYRKWESMSNTVDHKYWNGRRNVTDTTANICQSMMLSRAWKDLSARQRELYVIAKSQYFGAYSRPRKDYPEIEMYKKNDKDYFYLNHALVAGVYGLYPKSNTRDLYGDINVLIEHGFIERVNDGRPNKMRSIYTYSDKWKYWSKQNPCDLA